MQVLVLNGSPRPKGNTKQLVNAFAQGAKKAGHTVDVVDVCQKTIAGCRGCEWCHTKGNNQCVIQDDMQEVRALLDKAEVLILASPIYYHGFSGQLKCVIDRFYANGEPGGYKHLKKAGLILSSGSNNVYAGAIYSLEHDFVGWLGLENAGVLTAHGAENGSAKKLKEAEDFGASL